MKKVFEGTKALSKQNYQAPKVEVFRLGENLNLLVQSFSSPGELDQFEEGDELGVDEQGNPIA